VRKLSIVSPLCLMSWRPWIEAAAFALYVVCFAFSVGGFPLPWQDEVHILEMGRSVLEGDAGGSAFALMPRGRNFCPFYFLGPLISELGYRLFGAYGPRWLSLLWVVLAAVCCRRWAMVRWGRPRLAVFVSWLVLTNSLLIHSVRLVRVDGWAFAVLFLALAVLRDRNIRLEPLRFALVGFLFGVGLFVWPSALLFAPFLLAECLDMWRESNVFTRRHVVFACCSAGGMALSVVGGLLLSPSGVMGTLASYYGTPDGGIRAAPSLMQVLFSSGVAWTKEILRDPGFFILASLGCAASFRKAKAAYPLLCLVCFGMMIPSGLHTYRFLYLWPFLIWFAAEGALWLRLRWPTFGGVSLGLLASIAFVSSVVSYAVMAMVNPRPPADEVTRRLACAVGKGADQAVYSLSFQTYYAGRSLGWRQYRFADNSRVYAAEGSNCLTRVNAVIIPEEPELYAAEESFTLFGLVRNLVLDTARKDRQSGRRSCLGAIGESMAFRRDDARQLAELRRSLAAMGFSKVAGVSYSDWRQELTGWFRPLAPCFLAVLGYDDLEVWKRK